MDCRVEIKISPRNDGWEALPRRPQGLLAMISKIVISKSLPGESQSCDLIAANLSLFSIKNLFSHKKLFILLCK